MASSVVVGDWKNFTFKMIDSTNFPEVSKHLRGSFYVDEPVIKLVGPTEEEAQDFDNLVVGVLDEKLSFGAYDKETGKLAAVRIILRHGKDFDLADIPFQSAEARTVLGFVTGLDSRVNLFERYGVEEYAELLIASVDRDYRQQGLATEMYKRALNFLKESGFKLAKSIFTSPYTRMAATKFNFQEVSRRSFREVQNVQGDYLHPNARDDEFAACMALQL